ncbi:potassium channel family protein [Thalassotalea aquiviva]|uniref:potassium channel family protein n=1 Tax=Thalassotalea aquiviva TaxID=3242415 RepID=UPI00352AA34D
MLQKTMERSRLYQIDKYGVKNYNYGVLALFSFMIYAVLNLSLGYFTFLAETSVTGSPVQSYEDGVWLMVMSSTTIGFGDVYPITRAGRILVFTMFVLGVGILGGVGAVFANKIFGFADTNIKNRELRKQNNDIYHKLIELEKRLNATQTEHEQEQSLKQQSIDKE